MKSTVNKHLHKLTKPRQVVKVVSSWLVILVIIIAGLDFMLPLNSHAATSGQMTLYLHQECWDGGLSACYHSMTFSPPEPAADTATSTVTPATYSNASPKVCTNSGDNTEGLNQMVISAASTGDYCIGSFASPKINTSGAGSLSFSTGDAASITGQFWSSVSSNKVTAQVEVYIYRWTGAGITLNASDEIAEFSVANGNACAAAGTTITSCTPTAVSPKNNVTVSAGDRIAAVVTLNITVSSHGSPTGNVYFDSTARAASMVKLGYTTLGYASIYRPSLTNSLDDDFTTDASTTACTTGGVTYHTKWTCLQGSAASTTGNYNAGGLSGTINGDSSSWLWLQNQVTSTSATVSNFGSTPSNTFLYESLPGSYGNGSVATVLSSSASDETSSTTASSPYNHAGLVLWSSNTDYLEIQVYEDTVVGAPQTKIAINNSGTLSSATSITGSFESIYIQFVNTGGSYQPQYSANGSSFTNLGTAISHSGFSRVGLNAFTDIANPISSYAGAFEWFSDTMPDTSGPTTDQCLRGCEYFSGGSKQPYYWAN